MNYLVIGPEEYLKCRFLEKLKKSVLAGEERSEFNFGTFQTGQSEIAKILDFLHTLPFISAHRIAVIKDAEKFSAGEKKSILKYLKSPVTSTTLVILSSLSEFDSFLGKVSGFAKVIKCNRLRPGELNSWIRSEFARLEKKISPRYADIVRERIGSDLFYLKNEIEKISAFAADASEITGHHIEAVLGKAAYETAFELADLIFEKKLDRIFLALDNLLARERPHRILGLLAWRFRNIIRTKDLPHSTMSDLKRKLEIILEGDLFIKNGTMLPEDALQRVLVRLSL